MKSVKSWQVWVLDLVTHHVGRFHRPLLTLSLVVATVCLSFLACAADEEAARLRESLRRLQGDLADDALIERIADLSERLDRLWESLDEHPEGQGRMERDR